MVRECDRLCTVYRVILLFLCGAWISVHTGYMGLCLAMLCKGIREQIWWEQRHCPSAWRLPLACRVAARSRSADVQREARVGAWGVVR